MDEGGIRLGAPDAATDVKWNLGEYQSTRACQHDPTAGAALLSTRVIAGRIGAGKSRLLAEARATRERFSDAEPKNTFLDEVPPPTRLIHTLAQRDLTKAASRAHRVEYWSMVWRAALLCTLCAYADRRLALTEDETDRPPLKSKLWELHHRADAHAHRFLPPLDQSALLLPYAQLAGLHDRSRSGRSDFFFDAAWNVIESELMEIAAKLHPLNLFLDTIDNGWDHDPSLVLECEAGLVHQCLAFAAKQERQENPEVLRVTVAVRDLVWDALVRGRRGNALRNSPATCLLTWSDGELISLLEARIERVLPPSQEPQPCPAIERLCGFGEVPTTRGARRKVKDVLLDYSGGVPRDMINLGNALLDEARKATAVGGSLEYTNFHRRVGSEAHAIGLELLNQAATALQIELGGSDDLLEDLIDWLGRFPEPGFDCTTFDDRVSTWPHSGDSRRILGVLWRSRVIAEITGEDPGVDRYFDASSDSPRPPWGGTLRLHPSVYEVVGLPAS